MDTEQQEETREIGEPDAYSRGRKVWENGAFSIDRDSRELIDEGTVDMIIHHLPTDEMFPLGNVSLNSECKVCIPKKIRETYKIEADDMIDVYVWEDEELITREEEDMATQRGNNHE